MPDIGAQEVFEIDGNGENKQIVGAIGGLLGQMILTLNIIEKNFNRQLTSKSTKSKKSSKSGKSSKKAQEDAKKEEEDAKSAKSARSRKSSKSKGEVIDEPLGEINPLAEPVLKDKGWFTKNNIQNFIHHFVNEKLKIEKFTLEVGQSYVDFLSGLEKPMKLNEMRTMKPPNYSNFRELIRDPERMGDKFMAAVARDCENMGISRNTYHMVHEGFWDLYCKKPGTADLTAKKLEGWISRVNLVCQGVAPVQPKAEGEMSDEEVQPVEEVEVDQEQAEAVPEEAVKAIVRVRVPFKRPEPELAEGDEEDEAKPEPVKKENVPLEEIDYEDKVLLVNTQGENYNVLVIHQLAQRFLRENIAKAFKEYIPELEKTLDDDELLNTIEKEAEKFEEDFFGQQYATTPLFDFEIN